MTSCWQRTRDPLWDLVRTDPLPARRRIGKVAAARALGFYLVLASSALGVGYLAGFVVMRGAA